MLLFFFVFFLSWLKTVAILLHVSIYVATLEQLRKEGLAVNTFLTAEHKVRTSCVAHCSGGIYQGTYTADYVHLS